MFLILRDETCLEALTAAMRAGRLGEPGLLAEIADRFGGVCGPKPVSIPIPHGGVGRHTELR
jgi:hypothetical protein